jgi:hypothetical protein
LHTRPAGSLAESPLILEPQLSLDAVFKAEPTKNTILVQALKAAGLYASISSRGWRGTLIAPTDDVGAASLHSRAHAPVLQLTCPGRTRCPSCRSNEPSPLRTQAFAAALVSLNTNASALLKDVTTLRAILNYHVSATVVASPTALAAAKSLKMLNGKTVNVSTSTGAPMLIGEANSAGLAAAEAGVNGITATSTTSTVSHPAATPCDGSAAGCAAGLATSLAWARACV